MEVSKAISDIIAPLRERREQVQAEIDQAMAQVALLRNDLAAIDRVLKAADQNGNGPGTRMAPQGKKSNKKDKKAKDIAATPLTIERSEAILKLMEANPDRDWRASEIVEATGMPPAGVNVALTYMRQEEMIRATRPVQGGGFAYAPWKK